MVSPPKPLPALEASSVRDLPDVPAAVMIHPSRLTCSLAQSHSRSRTRILESWCKARPTRNGSSWEASSRSRET